MALSQSRMGEGDSVRFDDVVEGKGRGLILLLQYGRNFIIPFLLLI